MLAENILRWLCFDRPAGGSAEAGEIRSQQLAYFVRNVPINSAANLANSLIAAAIVWPFVPKALILAWLLPSWIFVIWHLRKWQANRRRRKPAWVSRRGPRRAAFWAAIPGLFWGCTAIFVSYLPPSHWLLLMVMCVGMTAGAAATLASVPAAASAFIVSVCLPWLVHFLLQDDPYFLSVTFMIVIFMLAMLATTRSVFSAIIEGIRVRHKNAALLQQFRAERDEWLEISDTAEAFALFDGDDRLLLCNESYRRLLSLPEHSLKRGTSSEELMRLSSAPLDHAGDAVGHRAAQDPQARSNTIEHLSNGRWLRTSDRRTTGGRRLVLHVDVTELKDREQALIEMHHELQRSERRLQDVAEASVDWFWEMDQDLRFTFMSRNIERLAGVSAEALRGKTLGDVLTVDRTTEAWRQQEQSFAARKPFRNYVHGGIGKDSEWRWIRLSGVPVLGEDGGFRGYRGSGSDVTKEVEALEALRVSEEQLRLVTDSLPVLICYMDRECRYLFANKTCAEWYARPREKIVGHEASEIHGESFANFKPHIERVLAGESVTFELTNTYNDGRRRDVQLIYVPHFSDSGKVDGFIALAEDTTERRLIEAEREQAKRALHDRETRLHELQRQLDQVSRLHALGQLSSALAHELNQPLAAIVNYVSAGARLLDRDEAQRERIRELLEKAVTQAGRAGDVIRRLRGLFESGEREAAPHDINEVVEDAAALALIDTPARGIAFDLRLAQDLPTVMIDRIQIQQVVLNLVRNAVDALQGEDRRSLVIETAQGPDQEVIVSISDSGPGLPDEIAARLFEPFVSSKANGMGLGLSISQRIIDAHEGRIWTESVKPQGTRFRFTLPAGQLAEAAE